jgi:hypothetical protein
MEAQPAPGSIEVCSDTGHNMSAWLASRSSEDTPRLGLRGGMWSLEFKADEARRLAYWLNAWWHRG